VTSNQGPEDLVPTICHDAAIFRVGRTSWFWIGAISREMIFRDRNEERGMNIPVIVASVTIMIMLKYFKLGVTSHLS